MKEEKTMSARKWHRWSDIKDRTWTKEEQERIRQDAMEEFRQHELRELQRMASASGEDVVAHPVPEPQEQKESQLDALRRYVQSLGGEIEVVAVIGDHRLRLRSV